jgi:hypothetical protein
MKHKGMKGVLCKRTGKKKFRTHEAALIRGAEIMAIPQYPAKHFSAYKCPFCKSWHLTSQEQL